MAFDIYIYVNMGVKRSVRTSGIQPTIVDIPQNCFKGQKLKYPDPNIFLCIFQNLLCIFGDHFSIASRLTIQFLFFAGGYTTPTAK